MRRSVNETQFYPCLAWLPDIRDGAIVKPIAAKRCAAGLTMAKDLIESIKPNRMQRVRIFGVPRRCRCCKKI